MTMVESKEAIVGSRHTLTRVSSARCLGLLDTRGQSIVVDVRVWRGEKER